MYSPREPLAYSVLYGGARWGYGAHEWFRDDVPYWNLFWLSCVGLEALLDWPEESAGDVPTFSPLMNWTRQTVEQRVNGQKLRRLLVDLTPPQFVSFVGMHKHSHLTVVREMGAAWIQTITVRSRLYVPRQGFDWKSLGIG